MNKYVETFDIPGDAVYGIAPEDDGNGFSLWRGGSAIGHAKTLAEARISIHHFSCCSLKASQEGYIRRLDEVDRSLERLGSDPFCLARFLG